MVAETMEKANTSQGTERIPFVDIQRSQEREESICISKQNGPAGFDQRLCGLW